MRPFAGTGSSGHETGAEHAHKVLNDRADQLAVAAAAAQPAAA